MFACKFAIKWSAITTSIISAFLILPFWAFRAPHVSDHETNAYIFIVILSVIIWVGIPSFFILLIFALLKNIFSRRSTTTMEDEIKATKHQDHNSLKDNLNDPKRKNLAPEEGDGRS